MQEPPPLLLSGASLFLDFDGTLVELASRPDAISVEDQIRSLLERLQKRLSGRVALLSGRSVRDVRSYLEPLEIAAGGSHGLELAHAWEAPPAVDAPPGLASAILELKQLEVAEPGVLVEEKPGGVAVHFRQAPSAEAVCLEAAERLAAATGMTIQLGKMVVELKHRSANKGQALKAFMSLDPFAGTKPVFIGDDLTDEDGFAAARELDGAGILVGPERPTNAMYRLDDVHSVRRWLAAECDRLP